MKPIVKPRVCLLGTTLDFYREKLPDYLPRWEIQLRRFADGVRPFGELLSCAMVCTAEEVRAGLARAEQEDVDAVLVVPLTYTCSGILIPELIKTDLPLVIWNTQEAREITASYGFDDLLMNHVAQGTQDLSCVLLQKDRTFGLESGHCEDGAALARIGEWLEAARACRFARKLRAGRLGRPFLGMEDFRYDPAALEKDWGVAVVELETSRFLEHIQGVGAAEVAATLARDRESYELAPDLTPEIHGRSARLELALRNWIAEERLDAFTMNFSDLLEVPGLGTLPFLGINKLMAEGLGYAGEGDVLRAAHMAQLRALSGAANFTEIYTVDYRSDRLLMSHMQECNPALARHDRKIRLVKKDFWAPGIEPYAGMWFTLEPGPVTLTTLSIGPDGRFFYIAYETRIEDLQPLRNLDIPHWIVRLEEPAGEFLNRYSLAGGAHHLVAAPGHHGARLRKLAQLQRFGFKDLRRG